MTQGVLSKDTLFSPGGFGLTGGGNDGSPVEDSAPEFPVGRQGGIQPLPKARIAFQHAHPLYATTFAIAGIPLTQPIMPEAVIALGCVPIAKYGTPSTVEIPDAVSEHLQYFDAVLLENHGALTYSDSLRNAYHKMESVEFYARLLWQTMQIGGPQELNKEQVEKLYEIRRQMGLSGKHPANLCPNAKAGKPSCHSCGGGCGAAKTEETPDADLVASITKKVMDQLGLN